jgi:hypothetical protein
VQGVFQAILIHLGRFPATKLLVNDSTGRNKPSTNNWG